jgi:putative ABC transport system substrate-binding protein
MRHREFSLALSLAARHKLPAVYFDRVFVAGGGLLSYGPDRIDLYRRAAGYMDSQGREAGRHARTSAAKYQLVINLKTAKALDLDVPVQLQQMADEVIE